jgi:DNA-binding GntR family transcriptional regulator
MPRALGAKWNKRLHTKQAAARRRPTRKANSKGVSALGGLSPGETTSQQAYIEISEAILAGAFAPGEILTQRSLAGTLGVSEMPVREALKHLISEGALQGLPNRSAKIPLLNRREVEQIFTLRGMLEGRAAFLAAQNITTHQIDTLNAIQKRIEVAVTHGRLKEYTALNRDFHFMIYRIADDPTLLSLIRALWLRLVPAIAMSLGATIKNAQEFRRVGGSNHYRIMKAFVARDAGAAEEAMCRDLMTPTKYPDYWRIVERLSSGESIGYKAS